MIRKKILLAYVDATAGHIGKSRTFIRIKERFMCHGMVKDAKEKVTQKSKDI